MTYDVVLTRKAERQIVAAARWWAKHRSAQQAQRWYEGLFHTLNSLAKDPQRCPLASEHEALPLPIRQIPYGVGRKRRIAFCLRFADNGWLSTPFDMLPSGTFVRTTCSSW